MNDQVKKCSFGVCLFVLFFRARNQGHVSYMQNIWKLLNRSPEGERLLPKVYENFSQHRVEINTIHFKQCLDIIVSGDVHRIVFIDLNWKYSLMAECSVSISKHFIKCISKQLATSSPSYLFKFTWKFAKHLDENVPRPLFNLWVLPAFHGSWGWHKLRESGGRSRIPQLVHTKLGIKIPVARKTHWLAGKPEKNNP